MVHLAGLPQREGGGGGRQEGGSLPQREGRRTARGGSLPQRVGRRTARGGSLTQRGEADGRGRKPDAEGPQA